MSRKTLICAVLLATCVVSMKNAVWAQSSVGPLTVPEVRLSLVERATLSAERTGILDQMTVREGDAVAAGDLVAKLRDQVVRAQLAVAEKQLENDVDLRFARKAAELANLEFSKSVKVNAGTSGTISEMELRKQRLASEKALLQLEQAQLQLEIAKLQRDETYAMLNAYAVTAPWAGVVMRVSKRRGEAVREGEPIVEIADLSRLRAEGYVNLTDSLRLQVGAPVQLRLNIPGAELPIENRTFEGRVSFIEPKVDPVTQKVRVWADIVNDSGLLKDGMQGAMVIATG
ncbi:MAG: hypothetical protein B7Z55_12260 [Planctomycetales bacterium 12-60-4]|nr:MAG: hypothetical protein B7Z55_12260 [Planctomycetales bacterium 12-60-4]